MCTLLLHPALQISEIIRRQTGMCNLRLQRQPAGEKGLVAWRNPSRTGPMASADMHHQTVQRTVVSLGSCRQWDPRQLPTMGAGSDPGADRRLAP
jgi:hypothetical protein